VHVASEALLSNMIATAKRLSIYHPYIDANHAVATQDPFANNGIVNHNFLKVVALKYGPQKVFQKRMPGGFKIK
jgi:hypothetical protein